MAHIINLKDAVKEHYLKWYAGYSVKTLSAHEEMLNNQIKQLESQRDAIRELIEKAQKERK